jgi:hypothetical protein
MSATTLTPTRKGSVVSEAKSPSPAKQTFGCSMSIIVFPVRQSANKPSKNTSRTYWNPRASPRQKDTLA